MKRLFLLLWLAPLLSAAPVDVLLVADDAALQPLLTRLSSSQKETHAAWTIWTGSIAGKNVALARSEGDPLNAVAVTTLALRIYRPALVVVFGVARPHDPALRAGDVVVSENFAAFDGMVSPHLDLGAGSDALKWHKLQHPIMTAGEKETRLDKFPADAAAQTALLKLTSPGGRVVSGVLGSAHQVNREADRIAYLRAQWGTSTEDGESAHVAGAALLLGVPVVGFRLVDGTPEQAGAFALQFLEARP